MSQPARTLTFDAFTSPKFVEATAAEPRALYPNGAAVYYGSSQIGLTTATGTLLAAGTVFTSDVYLVAAGRATVEDTPSPVAPGGGSGVPAGGTTGQVLKKNSNTDGDASWASQVASYTTFEQPGVVATAAGRGRFLFGANATILSVRAACAVAPVGANVVCDVNKNGTTIFTTQANRPAIVAGANASSAAIPDVTAVVAGDYLTVDIDQVGSTTAGEDLVVTVRFLES